MRPTGFLRNPEDVFSEVLLRVLGVGQFLEQILFSRSPRTVLGRQRRDQGSTE
jgi:hypothetical protein